MGHHVQKDDNSWVKEWSYVYMSYPSKYHPITALFYFRMNLGSGRKLPKTSQSRGNKLFVHRSVKLRLDAGDIVPGGRYKSKAKLQDVTWVD